MRVNCQCGCFFLELFALGVDSTLDSIAEQLLAMGLERVRVAVHMPPEQLGIGRLLARTGRQGDPFTTTLNTSAW